MENSQKRNRKTAQKNSFEGAKGKKSWVNPKLVVENVESTRGGTSTCNAPGDDTWYVS